MSACTHRRHDEWGYSTVVAVHIHWPRSCPAKSRCIYNDTVVACIGQKVTGVIWRNLFHVQQKCTPEPLAVFNGLLLRGGKEGEGRGGERMERRKGASMEKGGWVWKERRRAPMYICAAYTSQLTDTSCGLISIPKVIKKFLPVLWTLCVTPHWQLQPMLVM